MVRGSPAKRGVIEKSVWQFESAPIRQLLGFRIMISMTGSDPVGNGLIPLTPAN